MTGRRSIARRPREESDVEWRKEAMCRGEDPELFYTESNGSLGAIHNQEAKNVCARCPVWQACLREAFQMNDFYGVRGGMTGREREAVARQANTARKAAAVG